jgi:SAM-dependent methyltransferase
LVSERDQPWEADGVLVMPVYEEQLVVVKRLVLKERLHIRRVATTERRLFEDTLRRERLVIDDPQRTGLVREQYPTEDLAGKDSTAAPSPPEGEVDREDESTGGLLEHVHVEQGDAYHLPYPDGAFDAAHCERLLMHLEDPVAALREMRRVVRPGGRVVVTEPDWAGLQIDHADRTAMRLLIDRWQRSRFANPSMGLELSGR